jgi:hypothetical protein
MAEPAIHGGHRGTRAVQRMVEFAPSTGGLALWMHHRDLAPEPPPPAGSAPVATDGHTLFYGPGFDELPSAEQVGAVAHAVLHVALRHAQRCVELQRLIGDVDLKLFNVCADAIVNSTLGHLAWLQLPAHAVLLERLLHASLGLACEPQRALLEWDVERLYRAIDDRPPPRGAGRRPAQGQSGDDPQAGGAGAAGRGGGSGGAPQVGREDGPRAAAARALGASTAIDLRPDGHARTAPELEAQQAREWRERLLRAHAGDGAFSMLRTLLADLPRSRTPWEQVLRTQLARCLSPRPTLSWSRPSRSYLANQGRAGPHRRMPWEPGFGGTRTVPRLVLVVDVSGSIDAPLLQRFAREIEAITRRLESALVLVIGDDRVRRVSHCEPRHLKPARIDLERIEFVGGGGTDFTPLLEEADRHRPDLIVVLTDLDGPARHRPRAPVLWAVPEGAAPAKAPFGRTLSLR